MRRRLPFLLLAASSVILAQSQLPPAVTSAKFGDRAFDAVGVCDANPEGVRCWDLDRKPFPFAEEGLRGIAASGNDLSFRLGKKNRYAVVRRPRDFSLNYRLVGGDYTSYVSSYQGDPVYDYVRLAVEPNVSQASVGVQSWIPADHDVDLPLQEGAKATVDGHGVEIGAIAPGKSSPPSPRDFSPAPGLVGHSGLPWWTVVMGIDGDLSQGVSWTFTPVGRDGKPILYVDAKGEPMSAVKAMSAGVGPDPVNGGWVPPEMQAKSGKKPKAFIAYFRSSGFSAAFRAETNVNPKAISAIRIRWNRPVTVALGPFPLDKP